VRKEPRDGRPTARCRRRREVFPCRRPRFTGRSHPLTGRSGRAGRHGREAIVTVCPRTPYSRGTTPAAAPWRGGRGAASPLQGGQCIPEEHPRTTTGAAGGIPVGVRPCLNRRPAQADHPDRRRLPAYHSDHDVPVPDGALPRRWRGGRGSASPLHQVARMFRSGSDAPRSVAPRPSCTGRAVPDPPAHLAGHESAPGHRCGLLYDRAAVYRIRITVPAAR
jgi:hypothetical protein